MSTAVIIPSRGRPEVLHETLASLAVQTRPPQQVVVAVTDPATDLAAASTTLPLPLTIEVAIPGTALQRNQALRHLDDDVAWIVFLDDDVELDRGYLEAVAQFFHARPAAALMTGAVLADGTRTGSIPRSRAREIVAADAASRDGAIDSGAVAPIERAYGCNMALPRALLRQVGGFDEALPLYGFMEDLDFSYRCARHGGVFVCRDARMVHLGHASGGRRAGARFGFMEIMNPMYLWQKGSLPRFAIVLGFWLRCFKNAGLSLIGSDRAYRRQRLRGNLLAFRMIASGRVDPTYVVGVVESPIAPARRSGAPSADGRRDASRSA